MDKASKKWNFDFDKEKPLPKSPSDSFEWERVSDQTVPKFYQTKGGESSSSRLRSANPPIQSQRTKSAQPAKPKKIRPNISKVRSQTTMKKFLIVKNRRGNAEPGKIKISEIEDGRVYFKTRSMTTIQTRSKIQVIDYRS